MYHYPSGEILFKTDAGGNFGHYTDARADDLVDRSVTSDDLEALYEYQDYIAEQVPSVRTVLAMEAVAEPAAELDLRSWNDVLALGAAATDDLDRLHPRHGQAPARGSQFVAGVRVRLLADQQFRSCLLPLLLQCHVETSERCPSSEGKDRV